jgi:hypothetical protein
VNGKFVALIVGIAVVAGGITAGVLWSKKVKIEQQAAVDEVREREVQELKQLMEDGNRLLLGRERRAGPRESSARSFAASPTPRPPGKPSRAPRSRSVRRGSARSSSARSRRASPRRATPPRPGSSTPR